MAEAKKKATKKTAKKKAAKRSPRATASGRSTTVSTPAPLAPRQPAPPAVPRVTIRNRIGQVIVCSVISDDGSHERLRLGPHATSVAAEDRLTEYTRSLAAQGKLTIDPVR
jgi:hypothetical protein